MILSQKKKKNRNLFEENERRHFEEEIEGV